MKKVLKAKVIRIPDEAVKGIDASEFERCAAETIVAPYEPMDFFENPVDSFDVADRLMPYVDKMGFAHEVLSDNGMVNTIDGHIKGYKDSRFAAIIPAIPVNDADKTPTLIVNTVNNGFRFCGIAEDYSTVDLGPVTEACIVGNAERPSAILIPVSNPRALVEGHMILKKLMDKASERYGNVNAKNHCCECTCQDSTVHPESEVTYTPRGWYI